MREVPENEIFMKKIDNGCWKHYFIDPFDDKCVGPFDTEQEASEAKSLRIANAQK